jgi:hypothetical protein
MSLEVPKPGSPEAVDMGCSCPIMDNAHGLGRFGLGKDWWINSECKLHSLPVEERERTDG